MIAYISGILQTREITGGPADKIVIEVAGLGYEIIVAHSTARALGGFGQAVTIHTSVSIRETEWTIFGFLSKAEKDMFCLLQSVTGVGPKLALALVGSLGTDQISKAVLSQDQKLLSQAPGVGGKVAQRIILELKSKMEEWASNNQGGAFPGATNVSAMRDEARSILEGLGYTLTEIDLAFKKAQEEAVEDDVELLVRHSLKTLGS